MVEVFLTLSFIDQFGVGLSPSAFHTPLTGVIDGGGGARGGRAVYLQLNLGSEHALNTWLSVSREKFHFLDLQLKKYESCSNNSYLETKDTFLQNEDDVFKKSQVQRCRKSGLS